MARWDREIPKLNSEQFRKEVTELVEQELTLALESIEETVRNEVTKVVPQVIPAILGLKRGSFGSKWEIDYMNGRREGHPLGAEFMAIAQEKAAEVVTEALKDWKPSKGMIAAVRKEYTDAMDYAARDAAQAAAAQDASSWAEKFVNDVLDGKFDTPGRPAKEAVLREIAEGKLKGAKAVEAAAAVLGKEE